MEMKLNSVAALTFYIKDLAATAKFYDDLGFRFGEQDEISLKVYLNWFSMKFIVDPTKASTGEGVLINIKVVDAEGFYAGVVEKGYKPESEPLAVSKVSKEFILRDPDGYALVIFDKK